MSSEWELDEGIQSIKSAWRREHTARANLEKMLEQAEAERKQSAERCAKTLEVGTRWMAKAARFESENTKLRELCRRYGEYLSQDRCEGCVYKMRCNNGFIDECWQLSEIRDLARELGIEVDI